MDLQERLIELSEYGASFNVANGSFVIKIKYDSSWSIIQPDDSDIAFYRDESDSSVYYYVSPVSVSIDKIFAAIDETINYNRELEIKVELFKEKMAELQDIFSKESLEVLNTLEFKYKKKKEKPIKKEKNVKTDDISEVITEEKVEVEDEKISEIDDKINKALKGK